MHDMVVCILRCVVGCARGGLVASSMLGQGCHGGEERPRLHAGFPRKDSSASTTCPPIRILCSSSWNMSFIVCTSDDLGTWTPTWSAIIEIGGFDPSGANRRTYAGLVHGIASRPKPKPKVPATPATGGTLHPHPPKHPGGLRQALGGHRQALGGHLPRPGLASHGMLSGFINLGTRSRVDLARAPPPPPERHQHVARTVP